MKYLKILGLIATTALTITAFAGSASATVLKNSGVNMKFGDAFSASITSSSLLKTGGGTTIATCTGGTTGGGISDPGGSGWSVTINLPTFTWSGCTTTVDTLSPGSLRFTYASGNNATVKSSGADVTVKFLGVSCRFQTALTTIGIFTGGNPATIDINGTIPGTGGFLCPESAIWSGAYTVTTPFSTLHAANS